VSSRSKPRITRSESKRGSPGLVNPWRPASVNAIGKRSSLADLAGAPREAAAAAAAGTECHSAAGASADHGASYAYAAPASARGTSSAASAGATARGTSSAASAGASASAGSSAASAAAPLGVLNAEPG